MNLKVFFLSVTAVFLCCTIQPGITVDIPTSREFVTSALQAINCLVRDEFTDDSTALVCSRHEIYRLRLADMTKTLIAGNEYFAGYREGEGDTARFRSPRNIVQINSSTILISDGLNHCIRLISGQVTSTYAGSCENVGFVDGALHESRFYWPFGMLKFGMRVFICDQYNNAVRLITLENSQVSTFLQLSVADMSHPPLPKRLACRLGDCDTIYVTFEHGVRAVNLTTGLSHLIAGGTGTGVSGPSSDSIRETQFLNPDALQFIDDQQLMIAENRNGGNYYSLNFTNSRSRSYSGITGEASTSIMCIENMIYIGGRPGLYRIMFDDVLPCGFAKSGDKNTTVTTTLSAATMVMSPITASTLSQTATSTPTTLDGESTISLKTESITFSATISTVIATTTPIVPLTTMQKTSPASTPITTVATTATTASTTAQATTTTTVPKATTLRTSTVTPTTAQTSASTATPTTASTATPTSASTTTPPTTPIATLATTPTSTSTTEQTTMTTTSTVIPTTEPRTTPTTTPTTASTSASTAPPATASTATPTSASTTTPPTTPIATLATTLKSTSTTEQTTMTTTSTVIPTTEPTTTSATAPTTISTNDGTSRMAGSNFTGVAPSSASSSSPGTSQSPPMTVAGSINDGSNSGSRCALSLFSILIILILCLASL